MRAYVVASSFFKLFFIDLSIFLHFRSLPPLSRDPTLPLDLVFFTLLCRSVYVSLRVLLSSFSWVVAYRLVFICFLSKSHL